MFRIITNLLFGDEDKPTEDIGSVEADDEEWHVVCHQDAVADEHQEGAPVDHHPNSGIQGAPISQQDAAISVTSPEIQDQNKINVYEAVHGIGSQPKGLGHLSPSSACEKAFAQRHSTSRNAFQRQNRIHQGFQQQAFHVQQPGRRNLCH